MFSTLKKALGYIGDEAYDTFRSDYTNDGFLNEDLQELPVENKSDHEKTQENSISSEDDEYCSEEESYEYDEQEESPVEEKHEISDGEENDNKEDEDKQSDLVPIHTGSKRKNPGKSNQRGSKRKNPRKPNQRGSNIDSCGMPIDTSIYSDTESDSVNDDEKIEDTTTSSDSTSGMSRKTLVSVLGSEKKQVIHESKSNCSRLRLENEIPDHQHVIPHQEIPVKTVVRIAIPPHEQETPIGFNDVFDTPDDLWKNLYEYEQSKKNGLKHKIKMLSFKNAVSVYCPGINLKNYHRDRLKEIHREFTDVAKNLCKLYLRTKYFTERQTTDQRKMKYQNHRVHSDKDMYSGVANKILFIAPIAIYAAVYVISKHNTEIMREMWENIDVLKTYNEQCRQIYKDKNMLFSIGTPKKSK